MTTTLDTSYSHGPRYIHTLMPKTHFAHSVDPRSRIIVDGDGSETCKPVAVQGTMSLMCPMECHFTDTVLLSWSLPITTARTIQIYAGKCMTLLWTQALP